MISAIGTAVFGLISFARERDRGTAEGSAGQRRHRRALDAGPRRRQEVPADWYFPDSYDPESATPPERIIYLQHGFLARGVFYDYTASYLAKQTNSVVVAPTLTSNIFATDGMWLGGDQMHRAVADLFLDGNPALLDSAQAAGYRQDQLPQQVVLVGHSLGGGLVIDAARYGGRRGDRQSSYKLAGVVMLDGVSFTDPVPILEGIPDDIPVYNLSSTPYPWNLFGTMDAALARSGATTSTGRSCSSACTRTPWSAATRWSSSAPTCSPASRCPAMSRARRSSPPAGSTTCSTALRHARHQLLLRPTRVRRSRSRRRSGPALGLVQPEPGRPSTPWPVR